MTCNLHACRISLRASCAASRIRTLFVSDQIVTTTTALYKLESRTLEKHRERSNNNLLDFTI